ncbi:MAG: tRNA (N6-isopentenyl adenosine(37)-C2)-methylthiotransferase MiaB [Spirochaetota bacterium]|nr:tRNA (N6-isopentenyl adenosine(37)-C2)-methylthiotransferase MiaB [Spirochaetota bacterium]
MKMKIPKTFTIVTFGCQMNKSDSELMEVSLTQEGFEKSITYGDIIIFNTCSVRKHAEDRALAHIVETRNTNKHSIIVVAGCMAQRLSWELRNKYNVDLVVGPYHSPNIGTIIKNFIQNQSISEYTSQDVKDFASRIHPSLVTHKDELPWHKWVTISHGCENYCAYCIVPYVRGKLISFPSQQIIDYCKLLIDNGITEITLLGQNVNQYGQDSGDIPFYTLLESIAMLPGLYKLNFLTSHPKDFNIEILHVIKDNPVIARSIHLPLQSGSDTLLQAMNRQYTMNHYYSIIEPIHKLLPMASISTDLIVGFPGETQKDFEDTINAVRTIQFDEAFTYKYSPREGTKAFTLPDSVPDTVKQERLDMLIQTVREISQKRLMHHIHTTTDMIVERISKKSKNEVMGKTICNHPVIIKGGKEDIGKKYTVTIVSLKGSTLYGERSA